MPEKEVSINQLRRVKDWIYDSKAAEFVNTLYPGVENGIWRVDGEPFVIYSRSTDIRDVRGEFEGFGPPKYYVFCSDKHAVQLTELGIVDFSAVPQQP